MFYPALSYLLGQSQIFIVSLRQMKKTRACPPPGGYYGAEDCCGPLPRPLREDYGEARGA